MPMRRLLAFSFYIVGKECCSYLTDAVPSGGPTMANVMINKG